MNTAPLIAEIAGLVGDPARAAMLTVLLDGRPLTATELAHAARITPQTASTHLAKLTEAGLLVAVRDGRHRYFSLASARIFEMLEGLVAVALENRPRYRPLSPQERELNEARICYDHLAGRLSVALTDFFTVHEYVVICGEAAEIRPAGICFLSNFGIDLAALSSSQNPLCRLWPRLDRTTPAHRGRGRDRAYEALLRSRLDGAEEAQFGCGRHRVGKTRFPGNIRHRNPRGNGQHH
jgi:DNA-binding transcriptional ArsR family regulator